ncbi:alkylation response protein AidB-like acyl-CoA dehydrogenase [Sphingomonas zeicaulis]|uniref:acyl-CoA dehydrogenase family protein n=1 Tax=Sphingomonas zeicaulis TaxID=1632740 RepID=UPI003D2328FE
MQFALTAEQNLIAETARGLFGEFAPFLRATIASEAGYDVGQWQRVTHEMGFGAIMLPEAEAGAGLGLVELALVTIEMGRTLFPSPFLPSIGAALPLLSGMPEIASGKTIAAPAIGPGLRLEGDRLSGEALVAFGHVADLFVAVVGDQAMAVPAAGAQVERLATMDVTRPLARVRFDRVAVEVVGGAARALDQARVVLAAECVGGADAALAATVAYAKQRIQFGRPIGSFQALKHRMADMMIAIEAARTAVYYAAAAMDEEDPAASEAAAIAHFTAIEVYQMVSGNMIQLHGGIGFTWEHDAHLHFKRARSATTLFGTPAESRGRLAMLIGLDGQRAA